MSPQGGAVTSCKDCLSQGPCLEPLLPKDPGAEHLGQQDCRFQAQHGHSAPAVRPVSVRGFPEELHVNPGRDWTGVPLGGRVLAL